MSFSPYVEGGPGLSGMTIPELRHLLLMVERYPHGVKRRVLCQAVNQDGLLTYVDGKFKVQDQKILIRCWKRANGKDSIEHIIELLDGGVNIDIISSCGRTLLMKALDRHNMALVEFLLKRGADPNIHRNDHCAFGNSTALHLASAWDLKAVQLLIDYGADVHIRAMDGSSPLSRSKTVEIEQYLQNIMDFPGIKEPDV
jgi:ankyrin repeat protein